MKGFVKVMIASLLVLLALTPLPSRNTPRAVCLTRHDGSLLCLSPEGATDAWRGVHPVAFDTSLEHPLEAQAEAIRNAHYGPIADPAIPSEAVAIYPGDDIKASIEAHPPGTTFVFRAGIHRMTDPVTPKGGNTFIGESGAVLNGSRLLTSFSREGDYWVATEQTQTSEPTGECRAGFDACRYNEDLFIDDTMLQQVTSLREVQPGRWFFDYGADKIYFADDPTNRKVETSLSRAVFSGRADEVTVMNLVVEKFASRAQQAALSVTGYDWTVEHNEARLNHGGGINIRRGAVLRANRVHSNGQLGLLGQEVGALVEGNEIAHNNLAGFDPLWEAGGTKFVRTEGLVVRGNYVHRNFGPGLWADIDNIYTTYEGNLVEQNELVGIFHEISYDAVVRDNMVFGNGHATRSSGDVAGSGILVSESTNVEIYNNVVIGNRAGIGARQYARGGGAYGRWEVRNLHVYDNLVALGRTGGRVGLMVSGSEPNRDDYFNQVKNNRFGDNTYVLEGDRLFFTWSGQALDEQAFRAASRSD